MAFQKSDKTCIKELSNENIAVTDEYEKFSIY